MEHLVDVIENKSIFKARGGGKYFFSRFARNLAYLPLYTSKELKSVQSLDVCIYWLNMTPHVIYIDLSFLTVSPLTLCVYPSVSKWTLILS